MKINKAFLNQTLGLCLIVLLSACSGFFFGKDNLSDPVDLPKNPQIISLVQSWRTRIGSGTDDKALHLLPALAGRNVYGVSADGVLQAVDIESGSTVWRQKIGHRIAAGVAADLNLVVVGSENGLLMAFSSANGEAGWTHQMSSEVLTPPIIAAGLVVARAIDGQVVALDARSGQVVWKQYIGVADLSIRGNARGLFLDGMLLYTNGRGRLSILSIKDGQPIFSVPLVMGKGMTTVERIADLLATPAIRNGVLFVSAYRHKTLAINLQDGSLLWESPYATANDLFADDRFVYLVDKNSVVHALDVRSGRLAWSNRELEGRHLSPVIGNGQWIAGIDLEGVMSFISAGDGTYLGRTSVGSERAYVAPILTRIGLLSYTADGRLALTHMAKP